MVAGPTLDLVVALIPASPIPQTVGGASRNAGPVGMGAARRSTRNPASARARDGGGRGAA